jgi:hypothetical protein
VDDLVLRIFRSEVAFQCRVALTATWRLNELLAEREPTEATMGQMWNELQAILVASANLSKMFWGSRGKLEPQRKPLRESFRVANDSPLRDTDLRNDFEHFDERIESWYSASQGRSRIFVGRYIGPRGGGIVTDDPTNDDEHVWRQFDPATKVVAFWDHAVSIQDIIAEVDRILKIWLAQEAANRPPPNQE